MEVEYLLSLKFIKKYSFDENFIKNLELNKFFNTRFKKLKYKKSSLLKNSKLQFDKNKIDNKINLILNKISNDNIELLVREFIDKISYINQADFDLFLSLIYKKIINEIQFVDYYVNFLVIIIKCYNKKLDLNANKFFDIIESNTKLFYLNNVNCQVNESIRLNNLILIKKLLEMNIMESNLLILMNSLIINQNRFISDIYNWFDKKDLSVSEKDKLENKLKLSTLSFRDKTFLKNLLNNKNEIKVNSIEIDDNPIIKNNSYSNKNIKTNNKIEEFSIETLNILNEYLYLNLIEEIEEYIKVECKDMYYKNIFCKICIKLYFDDQDNSTKLTNLLDELLNNRILYKSNLSRGLIFLIKSLKKERLDNKNLTKFLSYLKNKGITKGLEFLLRKYKV